MSSMFPIASDGTTKQESANLPHDDDASIHRLVERAQTVIARLESSALRSYQYGPNPLNTVNLDQIMTAMLDTAENCGGIEGKKYVASSIIACENSEQETAQQLLKNLGISWLTRLLFPFKIADTREDQLNRVSGVLSTPTLEDPSPNKMSKNFKKCLLLRDAFQCVVTGLHDRSHPRQNESTIHVGLASAHILPTVLTDFDTDEDSESYKSAQTTFHMLQNFAHLPYPTLWDFAERINNESNGMMLQKDVHDSFAGLEWCLKPTAEEHVYTLEFFRNSGVVEFFRSQGLDAPLRFRDRSTEFCEYERIDKDRLHLPDAHLISIHATIAAVVNMSGANEFFDALLIPLRDAEGNYPPMRNWDEFERVVEARRLREELIDAFFGDRGIGVR